MKTYLLPAFLAVPALLASCTSSSVDYTTAYPVTYTDIGYTASYPVVHKRVYHRAHYSTTYVTPTYMGYDVVPTYVGYSPYRPIGVGIGLGWGGFGLGSFYGPGWW